MKQKFIGWFEKEGYSTILSTFTFGFFFFLGLNAAIQGDIEQNKIPIIRTLFVIFTAGFLITAVIGIIGSAWQRRLQKRNAKK